jgi:hypothetical protein
MKENNISVSERESKFLAVELKFYPDKATALLIIDKNDIDLGQKQAEAKKLDLLPKKEFHFTLIGSDTGEAIMEQLENYEPEDKRKLFDKIRKLCESIVWKAVLTDDFYYLSKIYHEPDLPEEKRQSIIQLARIKHLKEFYKDLNDILGTNFATPMPHVTLFTNSTRGDKRLRGIGIYSQNDFEDLKPERI